MALYREDKDAKNMSVDIGGMRKPYKESTEAFTEDDLVSQEPIGQFAAWFNEACQNLSIVESNAMCLATATKSGKPSARMVLLKCYGKDGFHFFTNYNSRKGQELAENPQAHLCFYWAQLMRQVRIEGRVEKLSEEESTEYFHTRPHGSQIAACLSPQSQVIPNRSFLTDKDEQMREEYKDETKLIPKPDCWGGFRVVPEVVEFWQGQSSRVHDRIRFRKVTAEENIDESMTKQGTDGWVYERLAP
nr:pyridoxine/pyridoxamine 5'-phosphate oxidase-like isoform X2 [Procambarus clarkii]XP_045619311.1 pyridoxine/pyridoxamine 5'-phosphate oxidase-like isoform X2 [Procambarus clarkii]